MEKVDIEFKITNARHWADRLANASRKFDNKEISLAEYMVEIRAVKEITNLAYIDAVHGERTFLKDTVNKQLIIEVKEK